MATPVYTTMVPGPLDGIQPTLVKVCYWLEAAAEALGGTDATVPFTTMIPKPQDGVQPLLVKIAYWAEQIDTHISGGGGGTAGVTPGVGDPPTDGSVTTLLYKDTSTSFIYLNTGTVAVPVWDPI